MALDKRHYNWRGVPITPTMMQREMVTSGIWRCCINCGNFSPERGCSLASYANPRDNMPPPQVIIYGCSAWVDDIPF